MYYKQPGLNHQGLAPQNQQQWGFGNRVSKVKWAILTFRYHPKKWAGTNPSSLSYKPRREWRSQPFFFFFLSKKNAAMNFSFSPHTNNSIPSSGRNLAELLKSYQLCQSLGLSLYFYKIPVIPVFDALKIYRAHPKDSGAPLSIQPESCK